MSARRCALVSTLALLVVAALATPSFATFGGTNGRISFARFLPDKDGPGLGGLEIFSAKPDGTDEQRLTFSHDGRTSFFSDWSPDGSQIAFDSDRIDRDGRDDVVQIYVMPWNGDAFGLTQLTVGPGFHGDPGWSPDGKRIAIESDWNDYPALEGIWTIPSSDPDGVTQDEAQRVTTLPAGMEFDSEPQYSPDGQWIVFSRYKSCQFHNHGHLAVVGATYGCLSAIYKVRTDGRDLQRLTAWGLNASAPDWSPDGQKIAFDASDNIAPGERGDIYVMNADGSGKTKLTDSAPNGNAGHDFQNFMVDFANNPVWSPDATKLIYTHWLDGGFPTELLTVNPDGSGKTTIVDGDFFQNKPDWGTHP